MSHIQPIQTQRTFAMIKPDAVGSKYVPDILREIVDSKQFTIIKSKCFTFTKTASSYFYKEHKDKSFFPKLQEFMMSGTCFCIVLEGSNAIENWRKMIGPTSVSVAKETSPCSLRAKYGDMLDTSRNACHGSDSEASATREINFIFPELNTEIDHIFYTGIGCKDGYKHTIQDFINRMKRANEEFNEPLPQNYSDFTLSEWIEYSGAEIVFKKE